MDFHTLCKEQEFSKYHIFGKRFLEMVSQVIDSLIWCIKVLYKSLQFTLIWEIISVLFPSKNRLWIFENVSFIRNKFWVEGILENYIKVYILLRDHVSNLVLLFKIWNFIIYWKVVFVIKKVTFI